MEKSSQLTNMKLLLPAKCGVKQYSGLNSTDLNSNSIYAYDKTKLTNGTADNHIKKRNIRKEYIKPIRELAMVPKTMKVLAPCTSNNSQMCLNVVDDKAPGKLYL